MRPRAAPTLLALLAAQTPPRLLKKLDSDPAMAESWAWHDDGRVVTAGGETVTVAAVSGVLESLDALTCSCLLAPRCLHRLAVLSVLPEAERTTAEDPSEPSEVGDPAPAEIPLSEAQRGAASLLWSVATRLLQGGGSGCGVVLQGELLRAGFACRECGLYRAHAATQRVLEGVRALRLNETSFSLESWVEGLGEMLLVAHQLHRRGVCGGEWLGTARRRYEPVGNLKLWGLFSEPVVSATGYAGVVTWLCDQRGRLYQLSDVAPGDSDRVRSAYRTGAPLAGASHQQLGRHQLLIQDATASAEGRLGLGQTVKGALAHPAGWESPELDRLWQAGLGPDGELAFLEGEVLGAERGALVIAGPGGMMRLLPPSQGQLPGRDNLSLLARCPGRRWRWVVRLHPRHARTATALAVSSQARPEWHGRCNLGCDRLHASFFEGLEPASRQLELAHTARPFEELERALQRVALAGRGAATESPELVRRWQERGMGSCVRLWNALVQAARRGERDLLGLWRPTHPEGLAERWLALAVYHQAANDGWRRLEMSSRSAGPEPNYS